MVEPDIGELQAEADGVMPAGFFLKNPRLEPGVYSPSMILSYQRSTLTGDVAAHQLGNRSCMREVSLIIVQAFPV